MAPQETTTLRVPIGLRDEIAMIADQRGTTMLEVVSDAVHRLGREQWWDSVRHALDQLTRADRAIYRDELEALDDTARDGLG